MTTGPDSISQFEQALRQKAARSRRRKRIVLVALAALALAPAGLFFQRLFVPHLFDEAFELSDEERAAAHEAVAKARETAASQKKKAEEALVAAHGKLGPAEASPCSYRLPMLEHGDPAHRRYSFPMTIVTEGKLAGVELPHGLSAEAAQIEQDVEETFYSARRLDALREDIARLEDARVGRPYHVVLVEALRKQPKVSAMGQTFDSGLFVGRAYLVEYATGRVACAADVIAGNSDEVKFQYTVNGWSSTEQAAAADALRRDLDVEVMRAVAEQMRAATEQEMPIERLAQVAEAVFRAEIAAADLDEPTDLDEPVEP